jgi:ATP-binding cassette subfamily F protein uup
VVEARNVSFARGDRPIVRDFTATISRGDRVGLIGPNGSGKTTLLRLLLGELAPDRGSIRQGTGLEIAYFDQLRDQLDPAQTVFDSIADGADFVEIGSARKHVLGYLRDFLFPPERVRTPVRALSGGERNRLLLARLFTRQFNVLVLDEPTNDLDIETLDLLEELLLEFSGTLLLVSHDRAFLDNVVTSTLVFEGERTRGRVCRRLQRLGPAATGDLRAGGTFALEAGRERAGPGEHRKEAPSQLQGIEGARGTPPGDRRTGAERERLYASLADPVFLRDGAAVAEAKSRLASVAGEIAKLTERWETLETLASEAG